MNPKINYRDLLLKYIQHVDCLEGVTFLSNHNRANSGITFTDSEWDELSRLEYEANVL